MKTWLLIFVVSLILAIAISDEYGIFHVIATISAIGFIGKVISFVRNGRVNPKFAKILFWPFNPPDWVVRNYEDSADKAARPKCAQDNVPIPKYSKSAVVIEKKDGSSLLFCCTRCKTNYETENKISSQHLGTGMYREV